MTATATHHERTVIDLHTAERMLSFIDSTSRETWLVVGAGLKHEFGDGAFPVWDRWSQQADSYQPAAARATWKSFKPVSNTGRASTIGSVIHLAQRAGFRFDSNETRVVSEEELQRRRAEREQRDREAEVAREAAIQDAADSALVTWSRASVDGTSGYLSRKLIERAEGVKFSGSWLIVPMMRYDMPEATALRGIQIIKPGGEKLFTKGMAKAEPWGERRQMRGVACALALPPDRDYDGPIVIGEGYATCASVRAACGFQYPVFVAFDCGGLLPAAHVIRARWPKSGILFAADDDYLTDGNPGITKAKAASGEIKRSGWIAPDFTGVRDRKGGKDFNDLHVAAGLGAVTRSIVPALRLIERGRV